MSDDQPFDVPWLLVADPYPHIMTNNGRKISVETDGAADKQRDLRLCFRIVMAVNKAEMPE